MAAPQNAYAFDFEEAIAAAERWAERGEHHARFERAARNKRYSEIDTPERRTKRVNRLLGKLREAAPQATEAMAAEFDESAAWEIAHADVSVDTIDDGLLERVIGETRDFLFIEFLEQAVYASKAVGRIVTNLSGGRVSYGTGFMVSPRLLMTNHHVLKSADDAVRSVVEFDYQRNRLSQPVAVRMFKLDPAAFFLHDKELDFALVAVAPGGVGRSLADYGWCPMIKEEGKIVVGEPINIVQHPKGEMKQVIVRENRLVDLLDLYAHYEADTEPGSSGSPVFNNQWEVVALHHSGVPKRNNKGELLRVDGKVWRKEVDPPESLDWVANEGVRVSRLVEFIAKAKVKDAEVPLLKEFLDAKPPTLVEHHVWVPAPSPTPVPMPDSPETGGASVTLTVPLHITFSLGTPTAAAETGLSVGFQTVSDEVGLEKVEPDKSDPHYESRPGYDPDFLGFEVPFPRLTNAIKAKAFALPGLSGDAKYELKYHHYSLLFNKDRKLAFVAGVNYDPTAPVQHRRDKDGDKWYFDPRVSEGGEFQAGEDLYARNPLDRGHLVRRVDAGWGATKKEAKLANDDTFHFTNCSPQHAITNQGKVKEAPPGLKLWGKLEDHVATQGKKNKRKLCVFNGPAFQPSDTTYRGVKIPQAFWKVVVFANDAGKSAAAAFVLTQAALIQGLEEEFEVGEYKAVQVRVKDLEAKTNLNFGPFRDWDVLEQEGAEESFAGEVPAVVLDSVSDAVL